MNLRTYEPSDLWAVTTDLYIEAMHVTSSTGCAAIVEISTASTLDLTGLLSVVTHPKRWSTIVMCTVVQTSRTERGNVQLNWPKLFQAFPVNFTLISFHECVHSIIPHQHM